jgi:hypothetical protein
MILQCEHCNDRRSEAEMKWLKRVRGAIGMGLTWAAGWAVFGILIGVSSRLFPHLLPWDAFFNVFDAPLPALAVPGFFGGALFSIVLGIAGRGRKFSELSVPAFAAWGAFGGLMLSLLPALLVAIGMASRGEDGTLGTWQLTATIAVPLVLLSAISAAVSLVVARLGEDSSSGESGDDSTASGTPDLLGQGSFMADSQSSSKFREDAGRT